MTGFFVVGVFLFFSFVLFSGSSLPCLLLLPSNQPANQATSLPTYQPTYHTPTNQPTDQPTSQPANQPIPTTSPIQFFGTDGDESNGRSKTETHTYIHQKTSVNKIIGFPTGFVEIYLTLQNYSFLFSRHIILLLELACSP